MEFILDLTTGNPIGRIFFARRGHDTAWNGPDRGTGATSSNIHCSKFKLVFCTGWEAKISIRYEQHSNKLERSN